MARTQDKGEQMTPFEKMSKAIRTAANGMDELDARALTVAWATYVERLQDSIVAYRAAYSELREAERIMASISNLGEDDE
jgi:hypothetical protein